MGVDAVTFRIRIGSFLPSRRHRQSGNKPGNKDKHYSPYVKSSDIHLRVFASSICILLILHYYVAAMHAVNFVAALPLAGNSMCQFMENEADFPACSNSVTSIHQAHIGLPHAPSQVNLDFNIKEIVLLLAGDVELNPGPTELDAILAAIKSSEASLLNEMRLIRAEMSEIKHDVNNLKVENTALRGKIGTLNTKCENIDTRIFDIERNISDGQDLTENLRLDVDHLHNQCDEHDDLIKSIQENIESLNRKAIASNMRIFGWHIDQRLDEKEHKSRAISDILKVASPTTNWVPDDIKRIQVLNSTKDGYPPLTILTFRFEDDKARAYRGREELRKQGIRIGDDLTRTQRNTLSSLREHGKFGYFYEGQLHVKDILQQPNSQRRTVTGRRKAPPTPIDVDQNVHDVDDISEHVRMDGDQITSINE